MRAGTVTCTAPLGLDGPSCTQTVGLRFHVAQDGTLADGRGCSNADCGRWVGPSA